MANLLFDDFDGTEFYFADLSGDTGSVTTITIEPNTAEWAGQDLWLTVAGPVVIPAQTNATLTLSGGNNVNLDLLTPWTEGGFSFEGQNIAISVTQGDITIECDAPAEPTFTGQDITLVLSESYVLGLDVGAATLTGQDVTILVSRSVVLDPPGAMTWTGGTISIGKSISLPDDPTPRDHRRNPYRMPKRLLNIGR